MFIMSLKCVLFMSIIAFLSQRKLFSAKNAYINYLHIRCIVFTETILLAYMKTAHRPGTVVRVVNSYAATSE